MTNNTKATTDDLTAAAETVRLSQARFAESVSATELTMLFDGEVNERMKTLLVIELRELAGIRGRAEEAARYEALVTAARAFKNAPLLRGESGPRKTFTMTFEDTGVLEALDAALAALEHEEVT